MARKGLPKRYAKMGFKKGWKAYKRSKRKSRKGGYKVARRKRSYRRRASSGLKNLFGMSSMNTIIKAMVAGTITGALQNAIPDNALGGYGDVAALGVVGAVTKNKTLQTLAGYQLGAKLASGFTGQTGTTSAW